jgi:hypothetical protein
MSREAMEWWGQSWMSFSLLISSVVCLILWEYGSGASCFRFFVSSFANLKAGA